MATGSGRYIGQNVSNSNPFKRDTFLITAYDWTALRFVTDNRTCSHAFVDGGFGDSVFTRRIAGLWAFHCHVQWHMAAGLIMQFNVQPSTLAGWTVPEDLLAQCEA
jgi:hypothetical protein